MRLLGKSCLTWVVVTEEVLHRVHNHPHDGVVLLQGLDGDEDSVRDTALPLSRLNGLQHKVPHLVPQEHPILPVNHILVVYLQAFTASKVPRKRTNSQINATSTKKPTQCMKVMNTTLGILGISIQYHHIG